MIYYFSGTGSTRSVATALARELGEEARFIPDHSPFNQQFTGRSLGIVCPVYFWGIPQIVLGFLEELPYKMLSKIREGGIPVWVVLTYGDEAGNAMKLMRRSLAERGLEVCAVWGVQTPNTYVLMPGFDVDSKDIETGKEVAAANLVSEIAARILEGKWEIAIKRGPLAWLKTAVVYPWSCRWGIVPGKWHATDTCIGCGRCSSVCPVGNIAMVSVKGTGHPEPVWGLVCTACCGCYHICPTHSVHYGNITLRKGQKGL